MKNNLKFSIKRTPERDELIKQMADSNRQVALAAQEAFAKFVTPAVEVSINQKLVSNSIYSPIRFSKNERPTIPLDLFVNTKENHVSVWSQQVPGGLATNFIQGLGEYTFQVYRLDSAISMENDMAKYANLSVISLAMDRMANTIGIQEERNSWSPILTSLGSASTNGLSHVINSTVAGVFQVADLNALSTRIDRIWTAYTLGTPDLSVGSGLTDMYVSPEIVGQIRSFAYNPMNTRGGYKSDGTESTSRS